MYGNVNKKPIISSSKFDVRFSPRISNKSEGDVRPAKLTREKQDAALAAMLARHSEVESN